MNDTGARQRRSLVVVLLDGALRVFTALQSGPTPTPKVREAGTSRGLGRYALAAGVLVALAGTALLVVVLVRTPDGRTSPPDPAAALPGPWSRPAVPGSSGVPAVSVSVAPSLGSAAATTRSVPGTRPASSRPAPATGGTPPPLSAAYRTTAGLLGYRMTVTVTNSGARVKTGWVLTVTLPRPTLWVGPVSGATATQSGSSWIFVPGTSTSRVPAGGSVVISFGVNGATLIDAAPQACTIDGNDCAV